VRLPRAGVHVFVATLLMLASARIGGQAQATWTARQAPLRIFGNAYYVGTRGLGSILITSDAGHVLIDGPLAENVPQIVEHIRALGFRIEDVRLILNSHVHFDHAAGIADLQRRSGAAVAARAPSAPVLESGRSGPDDPQFGGLPMMKPVNKVRVIADGEVVRVGPLALTAHATGGHTPGGTSWSWRSCEGERCLNLVYADSLNAISADGFRYTGSRSYPTGLQDFERSFSTLSSLPCDILLTPHPEASQLWERVAARDRAGAADALVDASACRRYADAGRERLRRRIESEQNGN
jgi:metallo-beta-lactamase class B